MREAIVLSQVREALLATKKVILWRNNTGKLKDATGRWVSYGLGVGGADLVGMLRPSGRFFAVEVKGEGGRVSPEQEAWARAVNGSGGYACIVRSEAEALEHLGRAERGG